MANPTIDRILETKGINEAYSAACQLIRDQQAQMNALYASRFFEVRVLEDGKKKLWPTTEAAISRAFDLQDCYDGPLPDFFYCDQDGQLHTVSVGAQRPMNTDEECPFHYASSALLANGQVVGHVIYTDH
ncbi:hypothetical protein [Ralstonia pickettii]|uniref:Histidine kinase n=1 Tax=Ralstonia pickettii TaxID=329 RepID=A0AAW4Q5X4_RALPI|nr:hypothetical protein [Ralstonia pickettii]MBA9846762.1 hypothetical protein [Ralstonia pickettii]MBA9852086.1 hypothetical protein [Ralstonia pickettii]MBA9919899.1 hypothetical protein [Ralstonia pickettii]MBA9959001.1 hypothetical protein [Ralstonia pickettii]MBA9964620.1 hypothetical protein [Ralstonia pickettii]